MPALGHLLHTQGPDRGGRPQQQPHLRLQQGRQLPQQVRHRGHEEGAVQPAGQRRHGQHEQARGHGQGQPQDADIHNGRLVKSKYKSSNTLSLCSGEFLLMFGEKGAANGQFMYPWDVACNSKNQILVSDTRNHRLQLFSPAGEFLAKYGFDGQMWKHFDSPRGVCFTQDDQVNRLQIGLLETIHMISLYPGHCNRLQQPQTTGDQGQFLQCSGKNFAPVSVVFLYHLFSFWAARAPRMESLPALTV